MPLPIPQLSGEAIVFPPTKELAICHPVELSDEECTRAIVGLTKHQHALGVPSKRVVIFRKNMPVGMEEGLKPWVRGVVYHYGELCQTSYE